MEPQQLAVKYNPPKICLIYSMNEETLFHEFTFKADDLRLPSDKIYYQLKEMHPGYLEDVDPGQVLNLIELLKKNLKTAPKPSRSEQLRGLVKNAKDNKAAQRNHLAFQEQLVFSDESEGSFDLDK